MKKSVLLILASLMALSLLALAGCSKKYYNISVAADGIAGLCDENDMNSLTTAGGKSGFSARLGVVLENYYDADSLKVFANGEPVEFTKNPDYDDGAPLTDRQIAGTVYFADVRQDINVTFECDEKELSFTFKKNESNGDTVAEALKEFVFDDGKSFYHALTTEGYTYKTTWSEYVGSEGIGLTGPKIGTYSLYKTVSAININLLFNYEFTFGADMTPERNKYVLFVPTDYVRLNTVVSVNADAITENKMSFESLSGDILRFGNSVYIPWKDISELETVTVKLNPISGVDASQAEVYVNDVKVFTGADGNYRFSSDKLPIDFISDDKLADYSESEASTYYIRAEKADCSGSETLKTVTVEAAGTVTFEGNYYCDGNTAWYEEIVSFGNPFAVDIIIDDPDSLSYDLTVAKESETVSFDGDEIKALQSFEWLYAGEFAVTVKGFAEDKVIELWIVLAADNEIDHDFTITLE